LFEIYSSELIKNKSMPILKTDKKAREINMVTGSLFLAIVFTILLSFEFSGDIF